MEYQTKSHQAPSFSCFFVELKPAPNNKDILLVEYIQKCKIKIKPPKHKRDTAQCAKCQRYGHTNNYCYLKPRCVNAQVITRHSTVTERNARMMSDAFSVVATILLTTKDAPSTRNSSKKPTQLSVPNSIFLRLHFNASSTLHPA
jgi:hypothetical protein